MLGAVIFDMDGVLVDSEPLWHEAEIEEFARVGVRLTVEDCLETTGLRVDAVVAHWFARRPWGGSQQAVAAAIVANMARRLRASARPLPGAVEAVRLVEASGIPLGLASSSSRVLIDAVLERLGLKEAFVVCVSAEEEARGKPDPAVYLTAARALGVDPRACLAIEDSANGLRAAAAAHMRVIAVPDAAAAPLAAEVLALAEAVLPSLEAFPEWWRARPADAGNQA